MNPERILRFEIPSRDVLDEMARAPLPYSLQEESSDLRFYRVVYFDSATGELEHRGATVRLTIDDQGKQTLVVDVRDHHGTDGSVVRRRAEAEVTATDPAVLFSGISEPAQIIRALTDPRRLTASLELEISRRSRMTRMEGEPTAIQFAYDAITIRKGELGGELFELEICLPNPESKRFEGLVQQLERTHQARLTLTETIGRARELLRHIEIERTEDNVKAAREVAVVAYDRGRVALCPLESRLRVPSGRGSGHDAVRRVLTEHFGRPYGRIRYLGTSPGTESHPSIEVWLAEDVASNMKDKCVWTRLEDVLNMVGTPTLRDARTLSALNAVARSSIVGRGALRSRIGQLETEEDDADTATLFELTVSHQNAQRPDIDDVAPRDVLPQHMLNPDISRLLFDERILVMVEDEKIPLLERVKFLSMFWTRLDDFFMTRIADFKDQVSDGETELSLDGLAPIEQLEVTRLRARHVAERAYGDLIDNLLPKLAAEGIEIARWADLTDKDRSYLRETYTQRVETVITPVIADPTHPFPHIRNLRPAIAAIVRLPESTRDHFVAIQLPGELPRFVGLPGGKRFVPLEEIILAVLPNLYRGLEVVRAHTFRVTRSGNLDIAEEPAGGILAAVEAEVARRPFGGPVRLEVESTMPTAMRDRILRELQFEIPEATATLSEADVFPVERFVDLVALKEIAALPILELQFPPLEHHAPFDDDKSIFEQLDKGGDRLVCFPYDAFDKSVERLITEAADDPDVVSIKITLYRTDRGSRIVQALARAREEGKDAFALVELKASFDERRNVEWARSLESAGVHVVYSPANFKVHAKTALVVRREKGELRRYAYIGTGNLNAATARGYTDLGLFTTDPELTEEVNGVFNILTGYSAGAEFKHLLVSPFTMRTRFLELLDREVEHAKAGRGGFVRVQMNGLADRRMIGALIRASQAGVRVEMAVREICCLRPGIPGVSENITVVSKLGRFLQHSRIYRFDNAGEPEYFIGSADWRPRNLSKRVEVVTPIRDPNHRAIIDELLDSYLNDPDAWKLRSDGSHERHGEVIGGLKRPVEVSAAD